MEADRRALEEGAAETRSPPPPAERKLELAALHAEEKDLRLAGAVGQKRNGRSVR